MRKIAKRLKSLLRLCQYIKLFRDLEIHYYHYFKPIFCGFCIIFMYTKWRIECDSSYNSTHYYLSISPSLSISIFAYVHTFICTYPRFAEEDAHIYALHRVDARWNTGVAWFPTLRTPERLSESFRRREKRLRRLKLSVTIRRIYRCGTKTVWTETNSSRTFRKPSRACLLEKF